MYTPRSEATAKHGLFGTNVELPVRGGIPHKVETSSGKILSQALTRNDGAILGVDIRVVNDGKKDLANSLLMMQLFAIALSLLC